MEAQDAPAPPPQALVDAILADPTSERSTAELRQIAMRSPTAGAVLLEQLAEEHAEDDPLRASRWLTVAAALWSDGVGDAKRAARALRAALDLCPTDEDALAQLTRLYRDNGKHRALVRLLERRAEAFLEQAPADPTAARRAAEAFTSLGHLLRDPPLESPTEAIAAYNRAIATGAATHETFRAARDLYLEAEQSADALPLFALEREATADPTDLIALYREEAAARRLAGDNAGASALLRLAQKLDPDGPALAEDLWRSIADRIDAGETVLPEERADAAKALAAVAAKLEATALPSNDLAGLKLAFGLAVRALEGAARAAELVRQAEVLVGLGAERPLALRHAEPGFAGVDPNDAAPLLDRLVALAGIDQVIDLHERLIARAASFDDRAVAIAVAARTTTKASPHHLERFFASATSLSSGEPALGALERLARDGDAARGGTSQRRLFAHALAACEPEADDGGRVRAALLRRAATMARRELGDPDQAFEWLGDALFARLEGVLAPIEAQLEPVRPVGRASATLAPTPARIPPAPPAPPAPSPPQAPKSQRMRLPPPVTPGPLAPRPVGLREPSLPDVGSQAYPSPPPATPSPHTPAPAAPIAAKAPEPSPVPNARPRTMPPPVPTAAPMTPPPVPPAPPPRVPSAPSFAPPPPPPVGKPAIALAPGVTPHAPAMSAPPAAHATPPPPPVVAATPPPPPVAPVTPVPPVAPAAATPPPAPVASPPEPPPVHAARPRTVPPPVPAFPPIAHAGANGVATPTPTPTPTPSPPAPPPPPPPTRAQLPSLPATPAVPKRPYFPPAAPRGGDAALRAGELQSVLRGGDLAPSPRPATPEPPPVTAPHEPRRMASFDVDLDSLSADASPALQASLPEPPPVPAAAPPLSSVPPVPAAKASSASSRRKVKAATVKEPKEQPSQWGTAPPEPPPVAPAQPAPPIELKDPFARPSGPPPVPSSPPHAAPIERATPIPSRIVLPPPPPPIAVAPPPPAPARRGPRVSGDELIADLFQDMHELDFCTDSVDAATFTLSLAMDKLESDIGIVHLYDIDRREFVVVRAAGPGTGVLARLRTSEADPLAAEALRSRGAVILPDAANDPRAIGGRWDALRTALGQPLACIATIRAAQGGRFLGLIELGYRHTAGGFAEGDEHALSYIAERFTEFVAAHGVMLGEDS